MTLPPSRPLRTLLLIALCCTVHGFNVDVKNCIRHRGPQGSMFGFSVAQHKERGRSWLLIGAPEAQTAQPGVDRGGAVFRCGTSREDDCEEIPFDTKGHNIISPKSVQIDNKTLQWFGATVRSSGDNGVILACAPRYVYQNLNGLRRDPVGTCYVTKDFNDFSEYSPCRTRNWGHHKQGTCQAGLGASVSKDGKRLFIGAVGSWYWQGQLYSVNSSARLPYLPAIQFMDGFDEGQFYSQNLHSRPDVLSTNEGPPTDDDSYLGYSVAVGAFGQGSESGAAVGMPRGNGLLGKIVLYSTELTNLYNITGDQLGAYFGYSICVSDVDGDGGDDIIVGAPLYSEYTKNDGSYETGKVYVFLKKEGYRFYERNTRMGFNSKSRFGLALSSLGDINRDGYGDFAVGAPYDGPNELGAVYIYHGTKNGFREKYSQVIKSEEVSTGRPIPTFGFSLSGGTDLDNNQYPDLIVGAYESDTAYFMKSRPVAQMTTTVNFMSQTKDISLEKRDCTTRDGSMVPCLFLNTCLQYTGIGVDDQLNIEIQLVLDAKKPKSPRMFFLSEENRNVLNHSLTLDKNVQSCKKINVYLKNNIRDKLTLLEAELRYRIIEDNRRFTRTLTPVIDLENEVFAVSRDSISIKKNCGGDNVCIPNLRLIALPSVESFLLGSTEKLKVDIIVQNEGEDSFETIFDMTVPPGVNYVKIERIDNENDILVQCSAPSVLTNNTLHCDIGNPLPQNKYVQFKVVLEPYQTSETNARYEFNMAVNSTNPENPTSVSDNAKYLSVPLWVETDLIIEGSSKPVDVHYNTTVEDGIKITDEKQIGPQVIHIYGIRNKGPSDILEAEAYIDWPLYTLAGEPLLYLLEMPETNGPIKCEAIEEINPLRVNVDRKRKSYFESSGLISGGTITSVTYKGQNTNSNSNSFSSGFQKTFAELSEEEKKRFYEFQKKDEEDAKSETGDGSYRQKIRFQTQTTSITGGGQRNGEESGIVVNQGPAFTYENGGATRNTYESSGSSVYRESSQSGFENPQASTSNVGGGRFEGESDRNNGAAYESSRGGVQGNVQRGLSSNMYGVGHFGETESSQGSSPVYRESTGSVSHYGTAGSSSRGGSFDMESGVSGGSSVYRESSGNFAGAAHFGAGSVTGGESSVYRESSGRVAGGESSAHGESSGNFAGTLQFGAGSDVHAGATSAGHSQTYGTREHSGSRTWAETAQANFDVGANGPFRSQEEKWAYENRGNAENNNWNAGGGSRQAGGVGFHGAKNLTSYHESEKSRISNTTWNNGAPKTYVKNQWRTNDDGYVRNGSSVHIEDGLLMNYDDAVKKINTGGVTNVISTIPGDDSDLSVSLSAVTERQNQGFRQSKSEESETVQKWRTVDGKLYRVNNNADDWSSLASKGASTDVYEDYGPQNYRKSDPKNDQDIDGKFKLYTRFKRDTQTKKCGPTRCTTVKCKIGPLTKDQEVWLSFRSRAWVNTLKKVALNRPVKLSSTISSRVTKLPYIGKPDNKLAQVRTHEVFTEFIPRDLGVKPDIIPLWIVVLAAVAGTIILLLLVYLLYKCGFFKRNRPSSAPEKQPLTNRNGYQTGDEAL